MKKMFLKLGASALCLFALQAKAQTTSTFEDITLSPNSYYNGDDFKGGFKSGDAFFTNMYDSTFGPYWEGFSVSNMKDDSTSGYLNQYSAISGGGNNSENYGILYAEGKIKLMGSAIGKSVSGFYITNGTYAYYDMLNGSTFSKKFGGSTGNDPDYLRVVISAWKESGNAADTSIEVYLADFRNSDNSKDFILKDWQWVDLKAFGVVDSFGFYFESSDTGDFGINTPRYFCIDNFNGTPTGLAKNKEEISFTLFPNPTKNMLEIASEKSFDKVRIFDLNGRELIETNSNKVDVSLLPSGLYVLRIESSFGISQKKFIKE
jgi:hypothetical protein